MLKRILLFSFACSQLNLAFGSSIDLNFTNVKLKNLAELLLVITDHNLSGDDCSGVHKVTYEPGQEAFFEMLKYVGANNPYTIQNEEADLAKVEKVFNNMISGNDPSYASKYQMTLEGAKSAIAQLGDLKRLSFYVGSSTGAFDYALTHFAVIDHQNHQILTFSDGTCDDDTI